MKLRSNVGARVTHRMQPVAFKCVMRMLHARMQAFVGAAALDFASGRRPEGGNGVPAEVPRFLQRRGFS